MTIPASVYTNLSAPERIRAAVSALARNDDDELQTLTETCPQKSYRMTDPAFSDGMGRLINLALAVESDLQATALDYLLASRLGLSEVVKESCITAASLATAWEKLLAELGIPSREMEGAGTPRHPAVIAILRINEGEENLTEVQSVLEAMRASLAA